MSSVPQIMMHGYEAGPAQAGAEAWLLISDEILRGLNHALSNRIATVGAVAAVIEPADGECDLDMIATLGAEIGRLEHVLRLMRMIPRNPGTPIDPLRVSELLPDVLEAHEHHPDLRDVPCVTDLDTDVQPILVRESALAHALFALLTVAKQAVSDHGGGEVRVRCYGEDHSVVIAVEALAGPPFPGAEFRMEPLPGLPEEVALRAASWSLAEWPVELRSGGGAGAVGEPLARYELRLESMGETRRREAGS